MTGVEKMLTSTMIEIEVVNPARRVARRCLAEYAAELNRRFDTGFEPEKSLPVDARDLRLPNGLFLVATRYGEAVGCGALKFHGERPTEVKRMWVSPNARGMGVGRRLLQALEDHAAAHGSRILHLETNRALVEAIALYRSAGYREVAAFNDEPYAHHWFEKRVRRH